MFVRASLQRSPRAHELHLTATCECKKEAKRKDAERVRLAWRDRRCPARQTPEKSSRGC